jgi:FkbM family methyltransferase
VPEIEHWGGARKMFRRHVREVARQDTLSQFGRAQLVVLYGTRFARMGVASLALRGGGVVYLARRTLESDWATFCGVFVPRYCPYATDYDGAVVVDIGAHKGYFGAYALRAGARAVLSYEPERSNFAFLAKTAGSFARGSWTVRHAAVGAADGRAMLNVSAESWTHTLLDLPASGKARSVGAEEIDVVGIDAVLGEATDLAEGGRIVVKIDVEGSECELVVAAASSRWSSVSEVFVEAHAFADCTAADMVDAIEPAGLMPVGGRLGNVVHLRRPG